jgi:hypothetical protein
MEEYARVLIEKNGLPSLKDSINIGKEVMERKLAIYKKKIRKFEEVQKPLRALRAFAVQLPAPPKNSH